MKKLLFMLLSMGIISFSVIMAGCDAIPQSEEDVLVIEAFYNAGAPLPPIRVTLANQLNESIEPKPNGVTNANITLFLDDQPISYQPASTPGLYEPTPEFQALILEPHTITRTEVLWKSELITSIDSIPPFIAIDDIKVSIPPEPVTAILVDTLLFDSPEVGARKGFIYPIDVTISWTSRPTSAIANEPYWIETRLIPQTDFSSTVLDYLLLTEEVFSESKTNAAGDIVHSWTGVYAVPVDDSLAAPPDHNLTIQLIRGTQAYADFASTRHLPERREPISNVQGAIGIVAGIALDSTQFEVKNGLATERN